MRKHPTSLLLLLTIVGLSLLGAAQAEVVNSAPSGFVIRQQRDLVAPVDIAWRMFNGHIGEWWHSDHTYSGNSANLYIEQRALGCFCERLGESGVVVHLTVTMLEEHKLLRLTGGLGPLGLMGVDGNMTVSFATSDDKTSIALEYRVGGYDPNGLDKYAAAVDGMLAEQLDRFVRFVESGVADSAAQELSEIE